jgi:hypothetical protein
MTATQQSQKLSLWFVDDGQWIEKTYDTIDPSWREALKLLVENHSQVRIVYNQSNSSCQPLPD